MLKRNLKQSSLLLMTAVFLIILPLSFLDGLSAQKDSSGTLKENDIKKTPGTNLARKIGGVEFIYIKSGTFTMGSQETIEKHDEVPAHRVKVDSFLISMHEITQAQYQKIMGKNPVRAKNKKDDPAILPVHSVTWYEAMEFCKKFSKKYKIKARLPYEAEWEYACRAGTETKYFWGNDADPHYCWFRENSGLHVHPVGKKMPNQWGIHDMCGNLWEWCMDWYGADYYKNSPEDNPKGPAEGKYKILRGGSWESQKYSLRSANRQRTKPDDYGDDAGFRIVIDFHN